LSSLSEDLSLISLADLSSSLEAMIYLALIELRPSFFGKLIWNFLLKMLLFSFSSLSSVGEVGLVRVLVGVLVVGTVVKPSPGVVGTLQLSEGASEGVAVALVK
jgi:hypothetical protein